MLEAKKSHRRLQAKVQSSARYSHNRKSQNRNWVDDSLFSWSGQEREVECYKCDDRRPDAIQEQVTDKSLLLELILPGELLDLFYFRFDFLQFLIRGLLSLLNQNYVTSMFINGSSYLPSERLFLIIWNPSHQSIIQTWTEEKYRSVNKSLKPRRTLRASGVVIWNFEFNKKGKACNKLSNGGRGGDAGRILVSFYASLKWLICISQTFPLAIKSLLVKLIGGKPWRSSI